MRRLALVVALVACDVNPPADIEDADGPLDADDPACFIYPADGYASIYVDDRAMLQVNLPPAPDVWGRTQASYAEVGASLCEYPAGNAVVRAQWGGELVRDPDCDVCSTRYRALFIEGLRFPSVMSCELPGFGCDPSVCRTTAATHAGSMAMWCDSPDEFAL